MKEQDLHTSPTLPSPGKDNNDVIVQVRRLNKSFGDHVVLKDFELTLHSEENLVVLGKSGSGKSVLIKCISGLITADSGTIMLFGEDLSKLDKPALNKLRAKIGFVFQYSALYDSMTVRENLAFPLRRHMREIGNKEVDELIIETLENVGLERTIDMMPSELSGGMKKRIGVARALILRPKLVLYDEPTAGLDPMTASEISELIVQVQKKYHTSSIIITHDVKCAEIASDRALVLANGKNYAEGTLEELRKIDDPQVKGFF